MVAEFRRSVETTSYCSLGAWGEQWYIDMILETNKSYLRVLRYEYRETSLELIQLWQNFNAI